MEKIFKVTGFCPCKICCGKSEGYTPKNCFHTHQSVAAPRKYPLGTKIYLYDYGIFYVDFVGGAIKDNRIDRLFKTHDQAVNWGVKLCKGKVLE